MSIKESGMHTEIWLKRKAMCAVGSRAGGAGPPRSFGSQIIPSPDLQGTGLQDLVLNPPGFGLVCGLPLLISPPFLSFETEVFILCHILKVRDLGFICRDSPLTACVSEENLHFLLNSVGIIKDNNIYLLMQVLQCGCGGQRITRIVSSLFTTWVPEIELTSLVLTTSFSTY